MEFTISPMVEEDRKPIVDIFNYYIANSFAAYPELEVPYEAFDIFLQMSQGYPTGTVKDSMGNVIGFGFLHFHNPVPAFSETAEVTYFISQECTGNGIGKSLLNYFEEKGKQKGIRNILAHISSLNPGSIHFHRKNGFTECGCFKSVGKKKGRVFDTIWMQKML
jgi:L-amino acid N-acyltransferase YncA